MPNCSIADQPAGAIEKTPVTQRMSVRLTGAPWWKTARGRPAVWGEYLKNVNSDGR